MIFIFLFFIFTLYPKEPFEIYFEQATQNYIKGNFDEAINKMAVAYDLAPENEKVKTFYLQILVERATQLYAQKKTREALNLLERARKIAPQNQKVLNMYALIKKEISPAPQTTKKPEVVPKKEEKKVVKKEEVAPEKLEKLEAIVLSLRREQARKVKGMDQKAFLEIIQRSEQERNKFFEKIEKKFLEQEERQKKYSVYMILGIIGGIGIILVFLFAYFNLKLKKREEYILKQQENLMNIILKQQEALKRGRAQLLPGAVPSNSETITLEEMLHDPNSRVRAKGIEILEGELVESEPEVAERILYPFLNDRDNRVRANACKALFRFNPERAREVIREMANSNNKWMRVSSAWVIGELEDLAGVEILKKLIQDPDDHIVKRALISLDKIRNSKKQKLPEKLKTELDELINGHAGKIKDYKEELKKRAKYSDFQYLRGKGKEIDKAVEEIEKEVEKIQKKEEVEKTSKKKEEDEEEAKKIEIEEDEFDKELKSAKDILKKADELKDKWKK